MNRKLIGTIALAVLGVLLQSLSCAGVAIGLGMLIHASVGLVEQGLNVSTGVGLWFGVMILSWTVPNLIGLIQEIADDRNRL